MSEIINRLPAAISWATKFRNACGFAESLWKRINKLDELFYRVLNLKLFDEKLFNYCNFLYN